MQRELISIPKILLYIAFTVFLFVFQTSILGAHPLFGYHLDLLPAAVAAAALLDGPVEGAAVGFTAWTACTPSIFCCSASPAARSAVWRSRADFCPWC